MWQSDSVTVSFDRLLTISKFNISTVQRASTPSTTHWNVPYMHVRLVSCASSDAESETETANFVHRWAARQVQ